MRTTATPASRAGLCGGGPRTRAWTCDCRLFRLRIELEPDAPNGVVYSYQHKDRHDWTSDEVATVQQALIRAAMQAVQRSGVGYTEATEPDERPEVKEWVEEMAEKHETP